MEKINGFKNSFILTEEGIKKTNLIIKDGKIVSIDDEEIEGLIQLDDKKIVVPGFIDEHIHGASGVDAIDGTFDAIKLMASSLPKEGVTAFLPTTTNQSIEVICNSLSAISKYMESEVKDASTVLGAHLEGPFISKKYMGAQLGDYILKPSIEVFKKFEAASNNTIKLVSMAIEEDEEGLVDYLVSKGIVVSIAHSAATYNIILEGIKKGVTSVTHTYNGMRPLRRGEIGMVGSAFLFDELYTELICDGVHSSSPAVKLLYKNKPKDKLVLVSDALRTKYMPDGKYYELEQVIILKGKEARLEDGKLAGSVLKINEAIKNLMDFANVDFIDAIRCATENPAKNLCVFDQMGSIKEGKLANFVIVDKDLNVYKTIKEGNIIYSKE